MDWLVFGDVLGTKYLKLVHSVFHGLGYLYGGVTDLWTQFSWGCRGLKPRITETWGL